MRHPPISRQECGERLHAAGPRLYRIAYCYVKNEQDALDIVGEASYKAFVSLDQLQNPAAFDSWITRLVITTAIDFLRRSRRCVPTEQEVLDLYPADTQSLHADERIDLYAALDTLEPTEKAYVILRFFEDLTFTQMAALLGVPEATVKSRLYRALRHLRAHYEKEEA